MSDQELPTFEIEVEEKDQDWLRVRLIKAPDGQGRSGRCLTPNPYRENYLGIAPDQRLKTLGQNLHNSLFLNPASKPYDKKYNEIGERFWKSYDELRSKTVEANQLCLRLLLDFSAAAGNFEKVLALPWEFLHDDQGFILLEKQVSITRQTTGKQRFEFQAIEPPMKVLLACAEPKNLPEFGGAKFLAAMKSEIEEIGLELELLPNAKLNNFKDCVEQSGCHIIHFIGHGEVKPSSATGLESCLYLESSKYESLSNPPSDPLYAKQLSEWITNARLIPKLILFSSCQTAVSDQYFERGMAHALLDSGVEAIVAMQANVHPEDAENFAKAIYQSLQNQHRIDEAVWVGRQQLKKQGQSGFELSARSKPVVEAPLKELLGEEVNLPAWGLPILLLNGDGWLGQAPPPDRILWQVTDTKTVEMVRIPEGNYYIDKYPVTSGIYYNEFAKVQGISGKTDSGDHPVTNITFEQATNFAHSTGRHLPKGEEWQMAARSGIPDKNQRYPWGNEYRQCHTQTQGDPRRNTLPVQVEAKTYPHNRNPRGMCGIIGNVAEFVVDDQNKPKLCGGSFMDSGKDLSIDTVRNPPQNPTSKIGFRCAATWTEIKQGKAGGKVKPVEG